MRCKEVCDEEKINNQMEIDDDMEEKIAKLVCMKPKATESIEVYTYRFDTCAEPVKCMVDEEDLIHWFVSGLKEPCCSKEENKDQMVRITSNDQETINKIQEKNVPTMSNKDPKPVVPSQETSLSKWFWDNVDSGDSVRDILEDKDIECTTSGHSDKEEPVVMKIVNNDGGDGRTIKKDVKNNKSEGRVSVCTVESNTKISLIMKDDEVIQIDNEEIETLPKADDMDHDEKEMREAKMKQVEDGKISVKPKQEDVDKKSLAIDLKIVGHDETISEKMCGEKYDGSVEMDEL
ncbi:12951_t:CDS:2, partial [Gigaspora rosea]